MKKNKLKRNLEAQKIKEWEEKFDKEQKLKLEEEKVKDERLRQRERLKQVIEEQDDRKLQDELFSKT